MTNNAAEPDIAKIRQLLLNAFTAEEFRRFCEDRPTFRPVVSRFGPSHGLDDMVDELITYCRTQLLFSELLSAVKDHNLRQYNRFAPYYPFAPSDPRTWPRWLGVLGVLLLVIALAMGAWWLSTLLRDTPAEPTPTSTAAATATPSATDTPMPSPRPTDTPSPTATATDTPRPTATSTPRPTNTPPPPTATETVEPTATLAPTPAVQSWTHPIKVQPNRAMYYIRLVEPGEIRVRAEWTGAQSDLSLIINGPGQVGYYARQDGSSPLEVAYIVTAADLAAGDDWRVTVGSFGTAQADGTVRVIYPSGSSTPFSYDFLVNPGRGSAASVLVLRNAGSIEAQATWLPAPSGLAFLINGPGQVGYYARQDGTSPLSVQYSVKPADVARGDTWLVRLVAFSPLTVEGNVSLRYP